MLISVQYFPDIVRYINFKCKFVIYVSLVENTSFMFLVVLLSQKYLNILTCTYFKNLNLSTYIFIQYKNSFSVVSEQVCGGNFNSFLGVLLSK